MPQARVLLVDTDVDAMDLLAQTLELRSVAVHRSFSAEDAVAVLQDAPFDAVVVSLALVRPGSFDLLRSVSMRFSDVPVVVIADGAEVSEAVEAMRAGAADFLCKPLDLEQVADVVDKTIDEARADPDPPPAASIGGLIGQSRAMQQVVELMRRAATGTATVLIRGESGTGKELVARALHAGSSRAARPFVKIHCAALPDTLLESELFGYERGAFTGATQKKPGRVDLAQGGTLFLDEIGDITPQLQVKLLRLLQDKEFERLGGSAVHKADVRFVTATHRDLDGMVKRGEFREDLFYRINVVTLWLPPLRARRDDVVLLAKHFCATLAEENAKPALEIEPDALDHLRQQRWPGNVRQLRNFVERLVVLSTGKRITLDDVKRELAGTVGFSTQATGVATLHTQTRSAAQRPVVPLSEEVRAAERAALIRALEHTRGNRTLAARLLGVSRATLYNKLAEHGIS